MGRERGLVLAQMTQPASGCTFGARPLGLLGLAACVDAVRANGVRRALTSTGR
jgi:hypothetical protein